MYHVMLAAGNEVPTVHVAFKLSLAISVFFSRIMRGSSFGSSMTCMVAMRMSVWNNGASSDTSHWNWPVKSRVTPRSVTEVASECVNWELMRMSWQLAPPALGIYSHLHWFQILETFWRAAPPWARNDKILRSRNTIWRSISLPVCSGNIASANNVHTSQISGGLTLSKSYWHVSVAAFPIMTASGTNIFSSLRQTAVEMKGKTWG